MANGFSIAGRPIGPGYAPYIIAELSGNHNGDIERAFRLIEVAKEAGADAVKFQTYTADSLTIDSDRDEFTLKGGTWAGKNLYHLYEEAHTPLDWFPRLFAKAKQVGITAFSSPFDLGAVSLLEGLNVPAYKIASNELHDWRLIKAVTETGKPIIFSVGIASQDDIAKTLAFIREHGFDFQYLAILHCVSAYPTPPEDANILTLNDIESRFDVISGFSDHTLGTTASIVAIARGASIIEKHITLDRSDGGPDSSFSLEPFELKSLCDEARWAWKALGKTTYGGDTDLKGKSIFTRQYWSIADISAGETLSDANVKSIRAPMDAGGLSTMQFRDILGSKAACAIPKHSPVTKDCFIAKLE